MKNSYKLKYLQKLRVEVEKKGTIVRERFMDRHTSKRNRARIFRVLNNEIDKLVRDGILSKGKNQRDFGGEWTATYWYVNTDKKS